MAEKIRVLMAKPGLDGHDRGVKVVARALRDAGMEVIYTGLHQTPEKIVSAALQEDVNLIGVSLLSGAHMTIFPKLNQLLKENNATNIAVMGGGIIPDDEAVYLKEHGYVKEIFGPGTSTETIVEWVQREVGGKN